MASSVCRSLQCLISALTQRGDGGHIFRLTSSVVLWGGRSPADKHPWRVWGALAVSGPHWVSPAHTERVLSPSTLLRLQVALLVNCLRWALGCVHFPGLSRSGSGSWALHKAQTQLCCVLCPSQVQAAQVTRCLGAHSPQMARYMLSPPPSQLLDFRGSQQECRLSVPCVSSGELISG